LSGEDIRVKQFCYGMWIAREQIACTYLILTKS